jgi:hypothetical protein
MVGTIGNFSPATGGVGANGSSEKSPEHAARIKQENPGITDDVIKAGPAAVAAWRAKQQGQNQVAGNNFGSFNLSQSNVTPAGPGFSMMA